MPTVAIATPRGGARLRTPSAGVGPCCSRCGVRARTRSVEFHECYGFLVVSFERSVKGELCARCLRRAYVRCTLVTLSSGLWGVISCALTPGILVANTLFYFNVLAGRGERQRAGHVAVMVAAYVALISAFWILGPDW